MSALIITLIVVVSVVIYASAAGAVGMSFYQWRIKACPSCSSPYRSSCYSDHQTPAAFSGLLWPLFVPILVGTLLASREPRRLHRAAQLQAEIERLERDLKMGGRR